MISEEQQEQAVLYALGLLEAGEADAFERELEQDADLRTFTRDCHESSASLALSDYHSDAGLPPRLKGQVMQAVSAIGEPRNSFQTEEPVPVAKVIRFPGFFAVPWGVAACLVIFCGLLLWRQDHLQDEKSLLATSLDQQRATRAPTHDLLARVAVCQMETPGSNPPALPRAAVVWDAARQEGVLQIVRLKPPATGKDYELWAVEAGRKEPVSAGLVRLDAQGQVTTVFKPSNVDGGRVLAFALSLEKEGGSPVNAGPIVLVGNL